MPRKAREARAEYVGLQEGRPRPALAAERPSRWDPATSLPQWRITREARALLTSPLRPIAEGISAIILAKLRQNPIRTRELVLCAFSDPEEDWKEVVFQIHVAAPAEEALALWDAIGGEIDKWKETLPRSQVNLLCERVGMHVLWED